jgi:hypothetical protein
MATQSVTTCDHCGERISCNRLLLRVVAGSLSPHREEVDLCGGCTAEWAAWLGAGNRPAPVEQPREEVITP